MNGFFFLNRLDLYLTYLVDIPQNSCACRGRAPSLLSPRYCVLQGFRLSRRFAAPQARLCDEVRSTTGVVRFSPLFCSISGEPKETSEQYLSCFSLKEMILYEDIPLNEAEGGDSSRQSLS